MAKRTWRLLESKVLCRQPGRYIGWPTVARIPDGELLVAFSGDRDAHVCPFGKSFLIRSSNGGRTWSGPELVNDTPLDDRDTGLCACSDGTLILSWFASHYTTETYLKRNLTPEDRQRWGKHLAGVRREDIERWAGLEVVNGRYLLGHWIRRSTDAGRTWEEPLRVPATTPHGPFELSDGRLLFVGNDDHLVRDGKRGSIAAAESRDQGRSWQTVGRIHMYPPYSGEAPSGVSYLAEPHGVEVKPGHLLVLARYEELPRQEGRSRSLLWQTDSFDDGRTWSQPRATTILGKPPHLTRLADGRILATYGYRHEPYGERACLSRDGGKTWDYDSELVLCDDAPSGDLGYPSSIQLGDGTILTVYYQQEKRGEKPCVMATHWALEG